MRLILELDVEDAAEPRVAMKRVLGAVRVLLGSKEYSTSSDASIVRRYVYIGAEHGASTAEEVLDVLPAHIERQVTYAQLRTLIVRSVCVGSTGRVPAVFAPHTGTQ